LVYTLKEARELHAAALEAYKKALQRRSYMVGSEYRIESQEIDSLAKEVERWERIVAELERKERGGGLRIGSVVCKR